ncbi:MAG: sugar ABC transporter substrate-binding protein, partial [Chloroflexi bacterium]
VGGHNRVGVGGCAETTFGHFQTVGAVEVAGLLAGNGEVASGVDDIVQALAAVNGGRCAGRALQLKDRRAGGEEREQRRPLGFAAQDILRADGLKVTESCLGATPNPDAIVAANDDMALGAAEAVKAAGLDIPVIGYDALPEAIKAIQDGLLYGSVEQFPGEQTRTSLHTLLDFINDGTKPASDTVFITPKMITSDNLDEAERIGEVQ